MGILEGAALDASHRLVIFGESASRLCRRLTQAAAGALQARDKIRLVAFVEASASQPRPAWIRRPARWILNMGDAQARSIPEPPAVGRSLRGWDVRWIVPAARNVNHPAFLKMLREEIRPTLALSFVTPQIFRKELLATCNVVVNYHNALLPKYRGVRATSWAMYRGEAQAGFTFHYMDETIDTGAILAQGAVAIGPDSSALQMDYQACDLAAEHVPAVLDMMVRGDPGKAQTGIPSYFGLMDLREIRRVEDLSGITYDEMQRRLRAFKWLDVRINGRLCEVTRFERAHGSKRGPALVTLDGVAVRARRYFFMPRPLYELFRVARRGAPI